MVQHAPSVGLSLVVVLTGSEAVAIAWYAWCRVAYVGYVASALRREDAGRGRSKRIGPEAAWRHFAVRASFLMDNDAIGFIALCFSTAGDLNTSLSVTTTAVVGLALGVFGTWMKFWAAASLAPGSYHWRNFFVPEEVNGKSAAGPYRFISNPMYTVGYAHMYGLAIALRSTWGLYGAMFAQVSIMLLLLTVERPHFARLAAGKREEGLSTPPRVG
jgi:phosphatidylethanolamine N-methyltransferase